jgi:MoaA/NifB/PqqE/SkfB family radical SAM enzyme
VDYICLAKSAGLWVSTTTNAVFLTRDKADALLEAGLDRLGLSIYSSNPQEHSQYTGTDTFDKVAENIKYFLERWAQTGRRTEVLLRFLTIPGVNEYQAYLRYWKPIADRVGLDLAVKEPSNWAGQIDTYSRREWLGFSLERSENGTRLVRRERIACPHLRYYLHVVHTGLVLPCCAIFEPEEAEGLVFGDLNRETITSIWRSARYLAFKEDLYHLRVDGYLPCRSCSQINRVKLRLPLSPRAVTSRIAARLKGRPA